MIKQKTVFVLGAGASAPYAFPLGLTLVDEVTANILSPEAEAMLVRLEAVGHKRNHCLEFANALRVARPYSIDTFLEMRPPFRDVGKAVIADRLLRAEHQSTISATNSSDDWYRYLFNRCLLLRNRDYYVSQADLLTIVTFNFDRSFERVLYLAVRNGFDVTDAEAIELTQRVAVHHVHGLLGKPAWLIDGPDSTPYGGGPAEDLQDAVRRAAREIRIVDEDSDEDVIAAAQRALSEARHVYFIGFSYDERNLGKLGSPVAYREANRRGTAYRMTDIEQAPVKKYFRDHVGVDLELTKHDAIGFLRERAEALFE